MNILTVENLKKTYTTRFGGNNIQALKDVSFSVERGEYVAIMGESGSGKTTLLNIIAALDKPSSGKVILEGSEMSSVKEADLAAFRRENLGFVFQEFNLLDTLSIEDNIVLPLVLSGVSVGEIEKKVSPVLVLFIIMSAMNGAVFVLYDIIMEAFVYAEILATVLVAVIFVIEFFGEWKAAAAREDLMRGVLAGGSGENGVLYTGLNGRLDKKSSGLGLFLCRKAGDLLAITITCESEVGKGTAFTLTFPEK